LIKPLSGHTEPVTCLLEFKNSILISGSQDKTMKFWNLAKDPITQKTIQNQNQSVVGQHSLCLIDETKFAIGSGCDINIYEYLEACGDTFDLRRVLTLKGHKYTVTSINKIFSKPLLISISLDEKAVWTTHANYGIFNRVITLIGV